MDLRGSYQIPPDISKSTGPDVFRKTAMTGGQSGVYPNISKVLLTVEDEQPHLMRSASLAKIDAFEANQTQISSKYFAQSNENSSYRQGNHYFNCILRQIPFKIERKLSIGEVNPKGSPFIWKEKAKLRKIIDVQAQK